MIRGGGETVRHRGEGKRSTRDNGAGGPGDGGRARGGRCRAGTENVSRAGDESTGDVSGRKKFI